MKLQHMSAASVESLSETGSNLWGFKGGRKRA
jgi:hypothetical protein